MQDILSEVPSDEELAAYLDQVLSEGGAGALITRSDTSLLHDDVVEAFEYLASRPIGAEFASTSIGSLFRSLQRLNALPRTSEFWQNTNRRPTLPQLSRFCEWILAEDPNDALSLLTISTLTIHHVSYFYMGRWKELLTLQAVSLDWVVHAAMFMEASGADDREEFSHFIRANGLSLAAMPILADVSREGGNLLAGWSRAVITSLGVS